MDKSLEKGHIKKRPLGISIIAAVSLISGIIALLGIGLAVLLSNWIFLFWTQLAIPLFVILGTIVFTSVSFSSNDILGLTGGFYFLGLLITSLAQLALGIGMLRRTYWSWILAIILLLAFVASSVIMSIYYIGDYMSGENINFFSSIMLMLLIFVPAGILYYLFTPNIRSYLKEVK